MDSILPRRVAISHEVVAQRLRGEVIVLDLESEYYHRMNFIALRIWQLLEEHKEVEPVVGRLLLEYEVDEQTLRHDLARLLEQWSSAGLITVEE